MHDTMKKPRHKTPSAAKQALSASGADEGDQPDAVLLRHGRHCLQDSQMGVSGNRAPTQRSGGARLWRDTKQRCASN